MRRGCRQHRSLAAADVYGGRHLLYEAVIAVYFTRLLLSIRSEDGSVAGLLRRRRILCRLSLTRAYRRCGGDRVAVGAGIYHRVALIARRRTVCWTTAISSALQNGGGAFRGFLRGLMIRMQAWGRRWAACDHGREPET